MQENGSVRATGHGAMKLVWREMPPQIKAWIALGLQVVALRSVGMAIMSYSRIGLKT